VFEWGFLLWIVMPLASSYPITCGVLVWW
jgi:hypothetical protein